MEKKAYRMENVVPSKARDLGLLVAGETQIPGRFAPRNDTALVG